MRSKPPRWAIRNCSEPEDDTDTIDHREGVAAEEVHIPEALRDAAVGHDDCDLVQRSGQQGPEIPVVVGVAHPGARVALDRVVEIGVAAEEVHSFRPSSASRAFT